MRRDGQHGRLLPRGLLADGPDPVEAHSPEHKPDDHVDHTFDTAKNATIKSPAPTHHNDDVYNIITLQSKIKKNTGDLHQGWPTAVDQDTLSHFHEFFNF